MWSPISWASCQSSKGLVPSSLFWQTRLGQATHRYGWAWGRREGAREIVHGRRPRGTRIFTRLIHLVFFPCTSPFLPLLEAAPRHLAWVVHLMPPLSCSAVVFPKRSRTATHYARHTLKLLNLKQHSSKSRISTSREVGDWRGQGSRWRTREGTEPFQIPTSGREDADHRAVPGGVGLSVGFLRCIFAHAQPPVARRPQDDDGSNQRLAFHCHQVRCRRSISVCLCAHPFGPAPECQQHDACSTRHAQAATREAERQQHTQHQV